MNAGVQRLLWIDRNVANLDRAVAFYCDALGFQVERDTKATPQAWRNVPRIGTRPTRSARLSLGAQKIALSEFPSATPYPTGATSADLWFQHCAIVVDDMGAAYARWLGYGGGVAISRDGPQHLPPTSGSVTAFKFRDPDGHPLELISFPSEGENSIRPPQGNDVALGIDHTAISVSNTDRSIAFYQRLGFEISSRGVNRGPEQQCLDDLAEVEVDVIALRPANVQTPHLELLGYRIPQGRKCPNPGVCDISADRMVLQTQNLSNLLDTLRHAHVAHITTESTGVTPSTLVALLSDPDGHWLVLIE
ncbi:VOC family protein [Alcaligenaceae bacterium]|nr:VOC family protein [Alcaligenaceae bacterium]